MTTSAVPHLRLGLILAVAMGAGCVPPPGSGDQSQAERYYNAGKSRLDRQDFAGAVAAYEEALRADPHLAKAHYDLGALYDRDLESPEKALYHYLRGLELDPDFQGADLISNRLVVARTRIASDSLPRIPSPLLEQEIDRLQAEVKNLRMEQQRLAATNVELNRQLAACQGQAPKLDQASHRELQPPPQNLAPDDTIDLGRSTAPTDPNQGPTSSRPRTHTLVRGETLFALTRRYGITMAELLAANPGLDPANYPAGKVVFIPR